MLPTSLVSSVSAPEEDDQTSYRLRDPHQALTALLGGTIADRPYSRDNRESWDTVRSKQPGQMHSNTSVTLHRPAVAQGQSSKKWIGTFPLTRIPSGQCAESAARISQLIASPFHPWSSFSQAAALSRRSETYQGIWQRSAALWNTARSFVMYQEEAANCRLTFSVSDSWKTASLFMIFCCFSWHWKKTFPMTWNTPFLGHFLPALAL